METPSESASPASSYALPTPPHSHDDNQSLSSLRSDKTTRRLKQIASLRRRGVSKHINLPQFAVCGDQSAGKSSVLEGITGLAFPRQEGLCTRFATEIIMTHTDSPTITIVASVIPAVGRTDTRKGVLAAYERVLGGLEELEDVIQEVGRLMGLRGFKNEDGEDGDAAFVEDVLRIEVSGPTGLNLTVVDLPGLIQVPSEDQTEDDVRVVHDLVNQYVENPRTIILAVVQASNDIANQPIVLKSKKYDSSGQRTVGIITKPDLINKGTEYRIATLAKNEDTTKLKLGFFLLKNPSPADIKDGITMEQRERNEKLFFSRSPWKEQHLDESRIGIVALRSFLQRLLDQHTERELPNVRQEIESLINDLEQKLNVLGEERSTSGQLRTFLSKLAMRFHSLATAATHGDYHTAEASSFFSKDEESSSSDDTRLRAFVHIVNTEFSNAVQWYGETMKVVQTPSIRNFELGEQPVSETFQSLVQGQKRVDEQEMKDFVMKVYQRTRGRELPGNYNDVLLTELFHHQSKRWKDFASQHLFRIYNRIVLFVREVTHHISPDERVRRGMLSRIDATLKENKKTAENELSNICADKDGHPITYDHSYIDKVQKSRDDDMNSRLEKAIEETKIEKWSNKLEAKKTRIDLANLLQALKTRVVVNMDEQACSEARAGLTAYYAVARTTFIDNVCVQVVERHLLRSLPAVFSPEIVAGLTDEELDGIAGEADETLAKRKQLKELHESLLGSLEDLRS